MHLCMTRCKAVGKDSSAGVTYDQKDTREKNSSAMDKCEIPSDASHQLDEVIESTVGASDGRPCRQTTNSDSHLYLHNVTCSDVLG